MSADDGPGGWLVTGVTPTVRWRQGEPGIMVAAAAAGRSIVGRSIDGRSIAEQSVDGGAAS